DLSGRAAGTQLVSRFRGLIQETPERAPRFGGAAQGLQCASLAGLVVHAVPECEYRYGSDGVCDDLGDLAHAACPQSIRETTSVNTIPATNRVPKISLLYRASQRGR